MIKKGWLLFLAILLSAGFAGTSYAGSVTLGGQVEVRAEYRENADFNDAATDENAWVEQRTRLTANAKVSDKVSAKITLQDSREWGSEGSTADTSKGTTNNVDLHEGYIDVALNPCLTARVGRQKVVKGDQRILGGFEWNVHARAFDGIALVMTKEVATVTAGWFKVKEAGNTGKVAGVASDQDADLWAAYAEVKAIPNNQLDLYATLLRNGKAADGSGLKPNSLYTVGARLAGNVPAANVDYTVEIPLQFGDTGLQTVGTTDDSYGGYAVFVKAGYTVPGATKVRLGAEYNFISGDDQNTVDSDQDAYINMKLGTDHMNYGYMDINNPSGALGNGGKSLWSLNAKAQVTPDLSLYVAYWNATINEVTTGASDDNGAEIDLQAVYKVSTGTKLVAGYGNYSPGDAQLVNGDNQDWAFLMLKAAF